MFANSLIIILALTFAQMTCASSVFDQCKGSIKYLGAEERVGRLETKILGETIELKLTIGNSTSKANYKILKSKSNGSGVDVWGELISGKLPLSQNPKFLQFTADNSAHYGEPEGNVIVKEETIGPFGNGFASATVMRCNKTKTPNQNLKMEN